VVTQPRIPCFKLNLKFGRDDMAKRFLASRRSGFYLRVLREGEVGPGDKIVRIHQDENKVSISDAMRVYLHEPNSNELARRALQVEYLSATGARNSANNLPSAARCKDFGVTTPWTCGQTGRGTDRGTARKTCGSCL